MVFARGALRPLMYNRAGWCFASVMADAAPKPDVANQASSEQLFEEVQYSYTSSYYDDLPR